MKFIEVFSKKSALRPVNLALITAVGIFMAMIAMVIFRVS
jgi:hypothetical protein